MPHCFFRSHVTEYLEKKLILLAVGLILNSSLSYPLQKLFPVSMLRIPVGLLILSYICSLSKQRILCTDGEEVNIKFITSNKILNNMLIKDWIKSALLKEWYMWSLMSLLIFYHIWPTELTFSGNFTTVDSHRHAKTTWDEMGLCQHKAGRLLFREEGKNGR